MGAGRLHVATVTGPHGVRGLVRLRVHAGDPALSSGPLFTAPEGDSVLVVTLKNPHGSGGFLASIEGVGDREAAQRCTGARFYIDRGALPEVGLDEVYCADLIGLSAVDVGTGAPVGRVVAVADFGAGDLLEVQPEEGETFYIPLAYPFSAVEEGRVVVAGWEAFAS